MIKDTETAISTQVDLPLAYTKLQEDYKELQSKYAHLEFQLTELKRLIFGSKSERFITSDSTQLGLFTEEAVAENTTESQQISYSREAKKEKKHPVRLPLASHLPRIEEIIEPENLEQGSVKIGEEITELLEYTPSKIYVHKIVRPKYALPNDAGVTITSKPYLT